MRSETRRISLLAVIAITLLTSSLTYADNIYVSCLGNGTIEKFDSSGNRSTFASGLNSPDGLAFDSSNNLYVANYGGGTIIKFDSSGNRSVFASGLSGPLFIATQVPEPAALLLLGLGGLVLRKRRLAKKR